MGGSTAITPATFRVGKRHPLVRFNNWIGSFFGDRDLPWTNLDEDQLIERARKSSQWEDFGTDRFLEPMRALVNACVDEGQLTYGGRGQLARGTQNALCTRLRFQRDLHDHPEILDQPIKRPLIIVGAPRTGTTTLNNLLSLDPMSRPLLAWEALRPAPLKRGQKPGSISRTLLAQMAIFEFVLKATAPELYRMHPFGWNKPDECHWLFWRSFVFPAALVLPSYHDWLLSQPESIYDDAYADYRLGLKMLEWQRPAPGHWVLKSPLHLWALGALAEAVPEASFIQTHRSLDKVLPSMCSLAMVLIGNISDAVEPEKMGPYAMKLAHETIERFQRARQTIDPSRILDLPLPELAADPIAAVRKVYDRFGYEYTPEYDSRLRKFLADRKRSSPDAHRYEFEQFNLHRDEIMETFEPYHTEFGLV